MKRSVSDKMFSVFNVTFFIVMSFLMMFPLLNVITLSLMPESIASRPGVVLLLPNPRYVTLAAYRYIFKHDYILLAFRNTVIVTLIGSTLSTLLTAMLAYGISDVKMPGQRLLSKLLLFTMMFGGGMIPTYMLVKMLGMINTIWALIVPGLVGAYNTMLMKAFFMDFPESLEESANIDGANDVIVLFRIVLPLSTPIIATIFLFKAVGHWNSYMDNILYISKGSLKTLQPLLRELLINNSADSTGGTSLESVELGINIKMSIAVISIVPIICAYPWLQKYFAKGIMIGAVKG